MMRNIAQWARNFVPCAFKRVFQQPRLWGETTLGKVLVAIRDEAMDSQDASLKALSVTAMVPTHQRHRTKHG